ncbi:MAG: fibronectin type III domain-containing protein [Candidatus Ancillula trichonymphae]|nr:fibronectin type III domain-containing protein [Candidatus Ancillula trichonymphae]
MNTPVTEVDLPHPPTNLTAKVTGSSVQVNWNEPSMAARTPVGSYFIKITNNDGSTVRTESVLRGTNTFTATGMASGHYNRVSVVARNQGGDSPEVAATCVIELEVKNPIAALPLVDVVPGTEEADSVLWGYQHGITTGVVDVVHFAHLLDW